MSAKEEIFRLKEHMEGVILGQNNLVERLLVALLADGHLLVEGAPGLAKTSIVKVLAAGLEGAFHRIQFTPDLLPADLTGTEVFMPGDGSFQFQQGPLFNNIILADEINRSPAKVQSALLEAMAERQVTVGRTTYPLPELFMVMATQNPIEQEGTYPLPEAQRDRFLLHVRIDYPDRSSEKEVLRQSRERARQGRAIDQAPAEVVPQSAVFDARKEVLALHLAPELEEYLVQLVVATRDPGPFDKALAPLIAYGGSPRATLALDRAARAKAWLAGRDYVSPEDIQTLASDVLRHRLLLSYEAEADGVTQDDVVARLLAVVAVP